MPLFALVMKDIKPFYCPKIFPVYFFRFYMLFVLSLSRLQKHLEEQQKENVCLRFLVFLSKCVKDDPNHLRYRISLFSRCSLKDYHFYFSCFFFCFYFWFFFLSSCQEDQTQKEDGCFCQNYQSYLLSVSDFDKYNKASSYIFFFFFLSVFSFCHKNCMEIESVVGFLIPSPPLFGAASNVFFF